MNWITKVVRPRIKGLMGGKDGGRGDTPENLWKKCPSCQQMIFHRDLVANLNVCPNCDYHMRIGPAERFAYTFDSGSFSELTPPSVPVDPIHFKGEKKYTDEIKKDRRRAKAKRRLFQRQESVTAHSRNMKTPQREFMDVRMPREIEAIGEIINDTLMSRVQKVVER